MNLDQATAAHAQWKTKFRVAISKQDAMDAETIGRDDCCELGKWLHKEGRGAHFSNAGFAALREKHQVFHAEAGRVATAVNSKQFEDAIMMIETGTPFSIASADLELALTIHFTQGQGKEHMLRQWANAFEFGAHGMVIADSKTNRFIACNIAFAKIVGRRPDEIVGRLFSEMFVPSERVRLANLVKHAESSGYVSYETLVLRNDAVPVPVQVDTVAIQGSDGLPSYRVGTVRDITVSKQVESELRVAAVAFESQEGMLITDAHNVILRVNRAFTELTGYSAEEVVGQTPRLFKSGRHDAAFYRSMWECINGTGVWRGEIWDRKKNGAVFPTLLTISAVVGANGAVTHYVGAHFDITERKKAEAKINALAFYDQLTGLPNRTLMLDRLKQALSSSSRNGSQGALLLIDLDHFKTLNDTRGHDVGDSLLKQVSQRLSLCVREGDTVARLGGDEFMVILTGLDPIQEEAASDIESVTEKILTSLRQGYQIGGLAHRSTASMGVALFKDDAVGVDALMKQADLAMYKAKTAGRNLCRFFDPALEVALNERAALESDLRVALAQNQFVLHYQAQVAGEARLTGVEVLVRWQHPHRGIVSPADFIPLAEETGLILPLGRWVLETACNQLTQWASRPGLSHLTVAVNVSAHQFRQPDFVDQVLEVLRITGANPHRLKLELTESLLVANVDEVIEKMFALKAKGAGFSLDDFGTGYSSLSYLKRLPLDQLKIDQSFVRDVLTDPNDASIARTIIALAQNLGLGVIAEGVETDAQRDFLAHSGCHAYQGYLFSRPLPLDEFEQFAHRF